MNYFALVATVCNQKILVKNNKIAFVPDFQKETEIGVFKR